jgi:hypothetical protein
VLSFLTCLPQTELKPTKRGDKGRVSGSSNLHYCTNSEQPEGIPMHLFPKKETDPQSERKLVNFIRKH